MNRIEQLAVELLEDKNCCISVRKAGSYRFPSSYRYEPHRHVEYEINYISSGNCVMTFEEEYVPLKSGECIVITPYKHHGFLVDAGNGCKIEQAEMSIRIPERMADVFPFGKDEFPYYKIRDCEDVVPLVEQVARFYRKEKRNEYGAALLDFAVVQLMVALGYHTGKKENVLAGIRNSKITGIMRYLKEHYNEDIKIEEVAEKWEISSRYVRKYFAEEIGMSCMDYLTVMRINKAKELLWETKKSVTDIAMETGYGTPQYFSRMFKKQVGMSPSEYRSSWKEEKIKAIFLNE